MKSYLIKETLTSSTWEELISTKIPYVCLASVKEWKQRESDPWPMTDTDSKIFEYYATKAEVNFDALVGTFSLPDRNDLDNDDIHFSFVLDEKGIVFVDDSGFVEKIIENIVRTKRWNSPSLERFIYDFIDQLCKDDLRLMESFELKLDEIEDILIKNEEEFSSPELNGIRDKTRRLLIHYDQLIDLTLELEENENGFFKEEELHYFNKLRNRIERLSSIADSTHDYTIQLRDLHAEQIDMRMNHIMTILTVVTTIFSPLTLLTGWYGMNFRYMPELNWPLSYPILFCFAILTAVAMLWWFKKKKWL